MHAVLGAAPLGVGHMSDKAVTRMRPGVPLALLGLVLIVLTFQVVLPSLSGSRKSILAGVHSNLIALDRAKQAWASEHGATNGFPVSEADVGFPRPVVGETYTVNPIGVLPEVRLGKAVGKYAKGTVLRLGRAGLEVVPNEGGAANRSQPVSPGTNRSPSAAGSGG